MLLFVNACAREKNVDYAAAFLLYRHPTLHLSILPPPTPARARATSDDARRTVRRTAHGVLYSQGQGTRRSQRLPLVAVSCYVAARQSVPISFTYRARELFLSKHIECANYFFRNIRKSVCVGQEPLGYEQARIELSVASGSGEPYLKIAILWSIERLSTYYVYMYYVVRLRKFSK